MAKPPGNKSVDVPVKAIAVDPTY